jgi:cell division septation protein DedD
MPRNDDGEFELVLGNKQLLTVFFIVVVLLGIFATMGYIVGRSTVPSPPMEAKKEGTPAPLVVDPTKPQGAGGQADAGAAGLAPGEARIGGQASSAPSETKPQPAAAPPPAATRPPVETRASPPKPERQAAAPPAPAPAAAEAKPPAPGGPMFLEPSAGQTFLQVVAVGKADAEITVNLLRKRGFAAVVAPGPADSKLYRVLVGPVRNAAEISKTRTELEGAGFSSPMLRKY